MSHKNHHKHQNETNHSLEETKEEETKQADLIEKEEENSSLKSDEITEENEIEKWKDLALRSQAEMENLRKRTRIDIEKANRYANAAFARDLLPVADNLANAIDYAKKEIEKANQTHSECDSFLMNLLKGVEMTQKQLQTVFEQHQIQKMETVGSIFDPNLHKVIQEIEDTNKDPGTIIQELQSGYTIGTDRVLREAMVIVTKQ